MGQPQAPATPSGRKFPRRGVESAIGLHNESGPPIDIREAIGMGPDLIWREPAARALVAPVSRARQTQDWRELRRVEQRARPYNVVA